MGGHGYWDDKTHAVYENPQTLEEMLVALELRNTLARAARNLLYDLLEMPLQPGSGDRYVMKLTLLLNIGLKLSEREPYMAMGIKRAVHQFCEGVLGISLLEFIKQYTSRYSAYRDDPTKHL